MRVAASRRLAILVAVAAALVMIGTTVASVAGDGHRPTIPAIPNAAVDQPTNGPPGTTERSSVGDDERQANRGSGGTNSLISAPNNNQAISADGRWVAFASSATNLVPGFSTPAGGIFLRNRQDATTRAITWIGGGAFPNGVVAAEPSISADGSVVAFTAILDGAALPGVGVIPTATPYVLAWDAASGSTQVVSVAPTGQPTPGYQPSVSGDGRYIAYTQWAIEQPDVTPPALTNLHITDPGPDSSTGFHYFFGNGAPCTPWAATIQVSATDAESSVSSVTLFYQPKNAGVASIAMSSIGSNVWQVVLANPAGWDSGQVAFWAQAMDSSGNLSGSLFSSDVLYNGECIL